MFRGLLEIFKEGMKSHVNVRRWGFVFLAIALWGAVDCDSAAGRCGLLSPDQILVDVTRLTGLNADSLVLVPEQFYVYDCGVLKASFAQNPRPCKGPTCRGSDLPHPSPLPFSCCNLQQTSSAADVTRCVIWNKPAEGTYHLGLRDEFYPQFRSAPGLRPPALWGSL